LDGRGLKRARGSSRKRGSVYALTRNPPQKADGKRGEGGGIQIEQNPVRPRRGGDKEQNER